MVRIIYIDARRLSIADLSVSVPDARNPVLSLNLSTSIAAVSPWIFVGLDTRWFGAAVTPVSIDEVALRWQTSHIIYC